MYLSSLSTVYPRTAWRTEHLDKLGSRCCILKKLYIPPKIVVLLGGPMLYRFVTDAVGSSNDSGQTSEEDEAKNEAKLKQTTTASKRTLKGVSSWSHCRIFWTPIFPPYIVFNGTFERIKNWDTLPLIKSRNKVFEPSSLISRRIPWKNQFLSSRESMH